MNKYSANNILITDILISLDEQLYKVGKTLKWKKYESISFKENLWYQHTMKRGGLPIDFLITFFDYTESEALEYISSNFTQREISKQLSNNEMQLPKKNSNNTQIITYLNMYRFIDIEIINSFIADDLIYQDYRFSNCNFIGYDENKTVKHIHKRSIFESLNSFKGNTKGSIAKHSFHYDGKSDRIYVFEAPIDMLSYITLNIKDWQVHSYVALCGISDEALLHRLAVNSSITSIYLCLDNDGAGNDATNRITSNLCSQYKVFAIKSTFKDFNEDLKFKNNQPVISATIDSTIETKIELLKDCSSLMNKMKTKNISDLITTYSPFLYNYDSPFIKVKTETQYKLLITCATALIIAKQQFKHLAKNYTNEEMIDILKGSKEYNIKPKNIKSIPQDLVKKISEIKLMNQENIYMTKECKVQYIQLYIDFASFCLNTYVYLLNMRKEK